MSVIADRLQLQSPSSRAVKWLAFPMGTLRLSQRGSRRGGVGGQNRQLKRRGLTDSREASVRWGNKGCPLWT